MRAAVLRAPDQLEIATLPDPECPAGGLVIRVAGCSICGTDVHVAAHGHPDLRLPQIMGHEIAGTVVERGAVVEGYPPGSRVAVWSLVPCGHCDACRGAEHNFCPAMVGFGFKLPGGFAEYMAVPAEAVRTGAVFEVAPSLPLAHAALCEPLACVLNGQERVQVRLGDTVAVLGAGPIGCMHLLLAGLRGARRRLVVDPSEDRLELARGLGADLAINPAREDAVARVREATGGRGADVVVVATAAGGAQEQAVAMAARHGRVLFFAALPLDQPSIRLDSNQVHYRELAVVGSFCCTLRHMREALALLESRQVDAARLISAVVPLEGLPEALARARRGEGLKTVVEPIGPNPRPPFPNGKGAGG